MPQPLEGLNAHLAGSAGDVKQGPTTHEVRGHQHQEGKTEMGMLGPSHPHSLRNPDPEMQLHVWYSASTSSELRALKAVNEGGGLSQVSAPDLVVPPALFGPTDPNP